MFNLFEHLPGFTAEDTVRLRRIERKLDLILEHLGIAEGEGEEEFPEQARSLAERGDRIGAIKAYRAIKGTGLSESKRAVEDYLGRHPGRKG